MLLPLCIRSLPAPRFAVTTPLPEILPAAGDIAVWVGLSGTTLIAVFAFIGFEHLVNVAEEMTNPSRTLPWALFLTLAMVPGQPWAVVFAWLCLAGFFVNFWYAPFWVLPTMTLTSSFT